MRLNPVVPLRPPESFETAHLTARKPRAEDAGDVMAAYAGDPLATRYLAWAPYTSTEVLAGFLGSRNAAWEKGEGHYAYLLCERGSDRPIGSIGVFLDGPKAMFGYVLGRDYWGRGYMTEALRFLVDWAWTEPGVCRAWAYCALENPSSARVMEKAGLEREGILRRWQVFPNLGPEPRDCVFYAKVK